ncbi:MAG: thioredoxin family protein [Cryomorphaceae bacterium]|nr:thioredoxin family protein [Cryomorphaceae bacterium]
MIELTTDNLRDIIRENPKVLVQYGATWCGNCRLIKPKFKRLAGENEGITFVYVDAEKFPNSRGLANVNNLPTFAAFANGNIIKEVAGSKSEILTQIIDEITNH